MKIAGLITEYNPFHNGHKYHLEESKKIANCDYTISVMSGNFLQRGEPAIVDKWTRAKMAIDNGVDLVIELPTMYACQSANYFAFGSVKLLDSLNVVDSLVFGSEWGKIDDLNIISKILSKEPQVYKYNLKKYLSQGYTYPKARSLALSELLKDDSRFNNINIKEILNSPNNILGIEYLKVLNQINSKIKPFTLNRVVSSYNCEELTGRISSATSIRKNIFKYGLPSIENTVSDHTYILLKDFLNKYYEFNKIENFSDIINYRIKLLNKGELTDIVDLDEDMYNRLISCLNHNNNIIDLLNCIKTKRYTFTRLQRVMMHILLNIKNDLLTNLYKDGPLYVRVLGSNKKGLKILKEIKSKSNLPIVTKFSNIKFTEDINFKKMIMIDKLATDIYYLGISRDVNKTNLDFLTTPYIKKK